MSKKGYHHTEEARAKMSKAAKGKRPTLETRLKLSKSRMGNTNSLGHHHGLETRRKIGEASKHRVGNAERLRKMAGNTKGIPKSLLHRRKLALSHQGKMASPETCEKVKVAKRGVRFYNWLGGLSLEPYSPLWTEQLKHHIRVRDHFICQLCGLPQGTSTHAVHHIDYDKKNCADDNLITLCLRCHQRTNTRRNYWQRHFQEIMSAAQEASRTALEVQGQLC